MIDRLQDRGQLQGALVSAIATKDKELLAIALEEHLGHVCMPRLTTLVGQNAAGLVVDVLHQVMREFDPVGILR